MTWDDILSAVAELTLDEYGGFFIKINPHNEDYVGMKGYCDSMGLDDDELDYGLVNTTYQEMIQQKKLYEATWYPSREGSHWDAYATNLDDLKPVIEGWIVLQRDQNRRWAEHEAGVRDGSIKKFP